MKRILFFLLLFMGYHFAVAAERPKVGLVLSGGGAKGVAHIGAIKVIEEVGIPIDIVVGTSMGSIIGGLYSVGYSSAQLDSIVVNLDWINLFSDKSKRRDLTISQKAVLDKYLISIPFNLGDFKSVFTGVLKGDNLESLFYELTKPYNDSINFNDLPIPYACVATDVNTSKEKVFHDGYLYKSMRASMAIPSIFTPQKIDGELYVDGGVTNNYPVDVAKAMGADIIIGVNVETMNSEPEDGASGGEEMSAINVLFKLMMAPGKDKYLKNIEETDVYIPVDMTGYSPASFGKSALDSIMQRGFRSTLEKVPELQALKKRLGMTEDMKAPVRAAYKARKDTFSAVIYNVEFKGFNSREDKWLQRNIRMKYGEMYNYQQLRKVAEKLDNTHPKSKIEVVFKDTLDGYNLEFVRSESYENRLNLGMNVNTEQIANIIASADFAVNTPCPSMFSLSAKFGKFNGLFGEYYFKPYAFGELYFKIGAEYNMLDTYYSGQKFCSIAYFRPSFNFEYSDQSFADNDLQLKAGFNIEYYRYVDTLYTYRPDAYAYSLESDFFINYYAGLTYDTFDRAYFPTKGTTVDFMADLYTDNAYSYKNEWPILALSLYWKSVFKLTKRLSFIPSAFLRHLVIENSNYLPISYANMIGGYTRGRYFDSQMPLESVAHLEIYQEYDLMHGISLTFRERFYKNHYIYLTGDVASFGYYYDNRPFDKFVYGGAIRYAYDSMLGPLSISLAYSNTSKFGFYIHVGFMF